MPLTAAELPVSDNEHWLLLCVLLPPGAAPVGQFPALSRSESLLAARSYRTIQLFVAPADAVSNLT
jgi:hypothetical protein